MSRRRRRPYAWMVAAAAVPVLTALGCGGDTSYRNQLRPPEPLVVSVLMADRALAVSPGAFGAGPVSVVMTNQSDEPRRLTVQTAGPAAGTTHTSGSIDPGDTRTMSLVLARGLYRVEASGDGIAPARLRIGPVRPSAQNDLLQP